jgi:hypothetical protein
VHRSGVEMPLAGRGRQSFKHRCLVVVASPVRTAKLEARRCGRFYATSET